MEVPGRTQNPAVLSTMGVRPPFGTNKIDKLEKPQSWQFPRKSPEYDLILRPDLLQGSQGRELFVSELLAAKTHLMGQIESPISLRGRGA